MNRRERRAAKKRKGSDSILGTVFTFEWGFMPPGHSQCGATAECYVCNAEHKARGFVGIREDGVLIESFALCDACLAIKDGNAVLRRHLDAPDLSIKEGGTLDDNQLAAVVEKLKTDEKRAKEQKGISHLIALYRPFTDEWLEAFDHKDKSVPCFLCRTIHKMSCGAIITDNDPDNKTEDVLPLCEPCCATADGAAILRKFLESRGYTAQSVIAITPDQHTAMDAKFSDDATEH